MGIDKCVMCGHKFGVHDFVGEGTEMSPGVCACSECPGGLCRVLHTPGEWEQTTGIRVLDADGWNRCGDLGPKDWGVPISKEEFDKRVSVSTIEQR